MWSSVCRVTPEFGLVDNRQRVPAAKGLLHDQGQRRPRQHHGSSVSRRNGHRSGRVRCLWSPAGSSADRSIIRSYTTIFVGSLWGWGELQAQQTPCSGERPPSRRLHAGTNPVSPWPSPFVVAGGILDSAPDAPRTRCTQPSYNVGRGKQIH